MTTKETITVVKTVEVQHANKIRFLPGDQRFVLWYGLAIGMLGPVPSTTGWFVDVMTPDERVWMLKKPVPIEQVNAVLQDAEIGASNGDCLLAPNPWCPPSLENAWYESAQRRWEEHTRKAVH